MYIKYTKYIRKNKVKQPSNGNHAYSLHMSEL